MFANFKKAQLLQYSFYLFAIVAIFFSINSILKDRAEISKKLSSKYELVTVSQAALKLLRDNNGSHIEFDRKQYAFQIMGSSAIKDHYAKVEQTGPLELMEASKKKKDELNRLDIKPDSSELIYLQNELLHDTILVTQIASLKLDLEVSSIETSMNNMYGLLFFSIGFLLCFFAMNYSIKDDNSNLVKESPALA